MKDRFDKHTSVPFHPVELIFVFDVESFTLPAMWSPAHYIRHADDAQTRKRQMILFLIVSLSKLHETLSHHRVNACYIGRRHTHLNHRLDMHITVLFH